MTGELARVRPAEAPVAADPAASAPVALPPHVVAAIATAAVEAYKEAERARRSRERHIHYLADRDRILAQQREYRARRKLLKQEHRR